MSPSRQAVENTTPVTAESPRVSESAEAEAGALDHEEIARLAYSYWQARGCPHGSPEEDWLRAEQELLMERLVWGAHAAGRSSQKSPSRMAAKAR
ncbi:MAG TPA: DUF2934 domain-containing protein [Bryobacteraceae bacterium]|nr:DUF2934 domain-containing protein [Bryobacteraceae bacterium]